MPVSLVRGRVRRLRRAGEMPVHRGVSDLYCANDPSQGRKPAEKGRLRSMDVAGVRGRGRHEAAAAVPRQSGWFSWKVAPAGSATVVTRPNGESIGPSSTRPPCFSIVASAAGVSATWKYTRQ